MPRRFFRKFAFKRDSLAALWWLAPFDRWLHDPELWGIRRRNVVPAFALGLFVCYMPFPGHMAIAGLLALAIRVNIPVAVASVWVSNPATMLPMFYAAYELGRTILGREPQPFDFELTFDWLFERFALVWQPLLLGSVLLGTLLSLAGYLVLEFAWRATIFDYISRRRQRRRTEMTKGR